jgi:signal transduction histidine kinase
VRAEPRDIDIVVAGHPPAIEADQDTLRRALDNLVTNAVRHSPDHGVVLVELAGDDDAVSISVADGGPGFPPEFLPHAFERFRRADSARARADGGSGLGLAIVDTIARAHGGHAEAHNRAEGGAEVRMCLPRRPSTT